MRSSALNRCSAVRLIGGQQCSTLELVMYPVPYYNTTHTYPSDPSPPLSLLSHAALPIAPPARHTLPPALVTAPHPRHTGSIALMTAEHCVTAVVCCVAAAEVCEGLRPTLVRHPSTAVSDHLFNYLTSHSPPSPSLFSLPLRPPLPSLSISSLSTLRFRPSPLPPPSLSIPSLSCLRQPCQHVRPVPGL
jgi:hypothetical protein